ncbi:MAG TPA: hypothetical protein PLB81_09280, partial [Deltaproteobacteria bacterium]|nr:hypothetical protein [Deltaproteobacteria bacterium]
HGTDDTGLAAPLLDLIIRVIAKMNTPQSVPAEYLRMNPGFQGDTLLDAVFAEISSAAASLSRSSAAKDDPIEGVIDALFKPLPGRTESPATILEKIAFVTARAARDKQFVAVFKADLDRLVDASEKMLMSADLEKIYKGLDMILALNDDPDPEKNTLARFMKNAVSGIAVNMDEEDIKGLIMTMASIDQSAYQGRDGVSEGIVQLMERNMYGQVRATAEVKTCALRSLLFLLPQRSRIRHLTLAGIETDIPLPSVLDSPDHPENEPGTVKNITTDTTEWAIGEIVTAVRWGREGKITMNGRSVPLDQFQAFDWVMYKKRYTIHVAGMHLPFMSFDGLAGMLSSPLVPLILPAAVTDVLPAVFEVAGGMSDAEYASGAMSGFTEESWKDRYGTAGRRHKLLALMVPLMEYAWNTRDEQGRPLTGALLKSLEGLNEIPLPPAYEPLKGFTGKNPRATLRRDDEPGVLKTLQDSDLLVYVMQPRGDNDILLPAMNLFGLIVAKLSEKDSGLIYREAHPEFTGNTLMDALLNEMSLRVNVAQSDTTQRLVDQVIKALFVPRSGDSVNLVSRMQGYIHRIVSGLYGDPAGTRAASRD